MAIDRVRRAVENYGAHHADRIGAFEAQFVVACSVRECRWLVLEAGIGGRYDPVRLARAPVSALVSLDLEHTELLGKTLPEIAFDKLDATAQAARLFSANPALLSRSKSAPMPILSASRSTSSGPTNGAMAAWRTACSTSMSPR